MKNIFSIVILLFCDINISECSDGEISNTATNNLACSGKLTTVGDTSGEINFEGKNYPTNLDCLFNIEVPDGQAVRIKFNLFDLESDLDLKAVVAHGLDLLGLL